MDQAIQDKQTVTPDGKRIQPLIEGVVVRYAITQADERGTVTEIYDPRWGLHQDPLVYIYEVTINPGSVKGWTKHQFQDDRLFFRTGSSKVVLYDDRPDSPTNGLINELTFTVFNRGLVIIPRLVWHAVINVSNVDAVFTNMPTRPYNHAQPDKVRLSFDSSHIPYNLQP